ncbi:hypothetical protein [uncultured Xanthomonas sp.]|uniref:hypothetical protein n=1 Tax=uncultured Xanthomonas sp. TaxID=152831 RepID=UPI0025F865B1|nr:hypothetical protein [uncultured Xanthomonas sp.]
MEKPLIVTLEAAFAGLTFLPWFAWAHNSLNPRLILHADHVEYRVLRTRTRPYREIASVDYRKTWGTENVVLAFQGAKTTFIANTGLLRRTREAIAFLQQQGCPLSARAGIDVTAKPVAQLATTRGDPTALRLSGCCLASVLLRAYHPPPTTLLA